MAVKINNVQVIDGVTGGLRLGRDGSTYAITKFAGTYDQIGGNSTSRGISSGSAYIPWGSIHENWTFSSQNATIGLNYAPFASVISLNCRAGAGGTLLIDTDGDGSGPYDLTWPTEFEWANDSEPTWTSAKWWYVSYYAYTSNMVFATAQPFNDQVN